MVLHPSPPRSSTSRAVLRSLRNVPLLVGLAVVYFGAAKLGLSMAFTAEQVSVVWPPAGIALAAVLPAAGRSGCRRTLAAGSASGNRA